MSTNKKVIDASIELEIPFYDVDSYRIVWHGNYPKYFEQARCSLLEVIGYPYQKMEASNYYFPIIDIQIRYIKPINFKQHIRVTATLKEWQNKLVITYLITDIPSQEILTKGHTTQVAIHMPDQITQYKSPSDLTSRVEALLST